METLLKVVGGKIYLEFYSGKFFRQQKWVMARHGMAQRFYFDFAVPLRRRRRAAPLPTFKTKL